MIRGKTQSGRSRGHQREDFTDDLNLLRVELAGAGSRLLDGHSDQEVDHCSASGRGKPAHTSAALSFLTKPSSSG